MISKYQITIGILQGIYLQCLGLILVGYANIQALQTMPFVSFFISDMYLEGVGSVNGVEYFFLAFVAVLSIRALVYIAISSDIIPIRSDALRLALCSSVIFVWCLPEMSLSPPSSKRLWKAMPLVGSLGRQTSSDFWKASLSSPKT